MGSTLPSSIVAGSERRERRGVERDLWVEVSLSGWRL
jgi:hypothetical protein